MDAAGKPIVWFHAEVKTPPFSVEARVEAGVLLRRLQRGERLSMPQSRPMPVIGPGCHELRVIDREATWRIIYFVDLDAIVILDVFSKKTRRTPSSVIASSRRRLTEYRTLR